MLQFPRVSSQMASYLFPFRLNRKNAPLTDPIPPLTDLESHLPQIPTSQFKGFPSRGINPQGRPQTHQSPRPAPTPSGPLPPIPSVTIWEVASTQEPLCLPWPVSPTADTLNTTELYNWKPSQWYAYVMCFLLQLKKKILHLRLGNHGILGVSRVTWG